MSNQNAICEQLHSRLAGEEVEAVLPPPKGKDGLFTIALRRGKQITICATDLGWWIREEPVPVTSPNGEGRLVYRNLMQMLRDMADHAASQSDPDLEFESDDDPRDRLIGFRCPTTGKTFYASLHAVKAGPSAWRQLFTTPAGRHIVGRYLWHNGRQGIPDEPPAELIPVV